MNFFSVSLHSFSSERKATCRAQNLSRLIALDLGCGTVAARVKRQILS